MEKNYGDEIEILLRTKRRKNYIQKERESKTETDESRAIYCRVFCERYRGRPE